MYSKKKKRFKRSQSYNDAPGPVESDTEDNEKDFLDDFNDEGDSGNRGRGGAGRRGLAARGRKFLKRISRSGSTGEQKEREKIRVDVFFVLFFSVGLLFFCNVIDTRWGLHRFCWLFLCFFFLVH